jgi:hypothetical protein
VIEVDDVTVYDGVGLKILVCDVDQFETVAGKFELDGFQSAGTDIESDDALLLFP